MQLMSVLILVVGSAAAGVAMGRVVSYRFRHLLAVGGVEAVLLGLAFGGRTGASHC